MKTAGIIIGIVGVVLFVWHAVKVVMGTDMDKAFMSHRVLSLIGGITGVRQTLDLHDRMKKAAALMLSLWRMDAALVDE